MFTQEELENKTGPELVAIFNGIPGTNPVKRFTNRETAIRRIISVSLNKFNSPKVEVAEPKVFVVDEAKTVDLSTKRKRGDDRGIYNLSAGPLSRSYRANSDRGRLMVVLLGDGATFADLLVQFPQWNSDQLHKTIRMINWWLGYAISTDESGIIRATR